MAALKCPKSTCSFLFDPDKVPVGALLACPRCQVKFRVGDAQAAAVAAPAEPVAEPRPAPADDAAPAAWRAWLPMAGIALLLAVGIGALVAAFLKYQGRGKDVGGSEEQLFTDHNAGIRAPLEPWERDRDLENRLVVNLGCYRRATPDAGIAYAAQKFDTRNARRTELEAFLRERLRKLCDDLQTDDPGTDKWLGGEAITLAFRGTHQTKVVNGECKAVSVAGTAYYLIAWAGERDFEATKPDRDAAASRIRLLGARSTWKESGSANLVFASKKLDYKLIDAESVWREPKNRSPGDQDPACDLYLEAEIQPKGKRLDVRPRAELLAYILPAAGDPMRAATDYVTKRKSRNPELYQEFVFETVKEAVGGDEPLGSPPGEAVAVMRMKMTHPKSPDVAKLIVVAAIEVNGKVVAVEAICPWDQRAIWERRLVNLAGSLRTVK
jgi:hypothetical protein